MSLLNTHVTVLRPLSALDEEEWTFTLINCGMKCIRYAFRSRKSKRHKWEARREWNWYSKRESFSRDDQGRSLNFNTEDVPWSDGLAEEAKALLMASIDKQIKLATQPAGQLT